jgi:citrate lyase beta subunit
VPGTTLPFALTGAIARRLAGANLAFLERYPGESCARQPVQVIYGGAHLFKADAAAKLGSLALKTLDQFAPDAATLARVLDLRCDPDAVYSRVLEKLRREPVEDLRIDFEDGYGVRPDTEEDSHAIAAAEEVAKGFAAGSLPPYIGIRIKSFSEESFQRSVRTLDLFLTTLVEKTGGTLPPNFAITYPKAVIPEQVTALADLLDQLETVLGLAAGSLHVELMIETTQSILVLQDLLRASRGRCIGAHFGAYDYTASCNITAASQHMLHPACDFARGMMQVAYAGTGIWLSDGATNVLPIGKDPAVVHRAWKLHYDHIRHSLESGFYQGWDLHPAQLPTRYAAVYAFFLEGLTAAGQRLRNFMDKAAQATLVGDVFDDAATGQGLLNYFLRALNCGAITEAEAEAQAGLSVAELRSGSFGKILAGRKETWPQMNTDRHR